ncbi:hypothetical protein C8R44DRAFT_754132 [Mycena epipterygia]|nr:hypothetical protein C8R44DRAFT_754132 [Mycena epipterygia]
MKGSPSRGGMTQMGWNNPVAEKDMEQGHGTRWNDQADKCQGRADSLQRVLELLAEVPTTPHAIHLAQGILEQNPVDLQELVAGGQAVGPSFTAARGLQQGVGCPATVHRSCRMEQQKELIWPVALDPEMKGAWLDVKRGAEGQLVRLQCARGCWVGPQTPLMGGPMLGLEGKNWPACGGWKVKSTALWEVPTVIDVIGGTSHINGINHLHRHPLGYFFFMKN